MDGGLVVVIVLALGFAYTNGFHDAASTIATSVTTRALTPAIAIFLAAGFNLLGALLGSDVAGTVGSGIVSPGVGALALSVVGMALFAALGWNLFTWWQGVPSSSSHALIGGLAGAGVAAGAQVHWSVIGTHVVLPMLIATLVALTLSLALTVAIMWLWRESSPTRTYRRFEHAQTISAAALALGHGLQDAQKSMGAMAIALVAVGQAEAGELPLWVRVSAGLALAAGTAAGGWRIVRTLGRRLVDLDAPRGFVAETVSAALLYASAYGFSAPLSTTHTMTAAVVGAGLTKGPLAVRWRVARDIGRAWVLTPVVCAVVAAAGVLLLRVAL